MFCGSGPCHSSLLPLSSETPMEISLSQIDRRLVYKQLVLVVRLLSFSHLWSTKRFSVRLECNECYCILYSHEEPTGYIQSLLKIFEFFVRSLDSSLSASSLMISSLPPPEQMSVSNSSRSLPKLHSLD